jgi:uncharacterized protein (DUF2236 family)
MTLRRRTPNIKPQADYGFFGPESITWKVFSYPSSMTVGFQRTVATEVFDPFVNAAVADTGSVMKRPALRFDRTLQYVATVAFGDTASVLKASDVLVRIHGRILGKEPISGRAYDANDPAGQLWIHLTQWHSVLFCYEMFGPGPLTEAEESQYWAECVRGAQFQTIDPDDVPRNRDEMRAYYARVRPTLAATEMTQAHVEQILNSGAALLAGAPRPVRVFSSLMGALLRRATIATLPHWMRRMAGLRQSRVTDYLIVRALRPVFATLHRFPKLAVLFLEQASPNTLPVLGPALLGIEPTNPVLSTPSEARSLVGLKTPREIYAEQLASRPSVPQKASPDNEDELLPFS